LINCINTYNLLYFALEYPNSSKSNFESTMKKIFIFSIVSVLSICFFIIKQIISQDEVQAPEPGIEILLYSPTDATVDKYWDVINNYAPKKEAYIAAIRLIEQSIKDKKWTEAVQMLEDFKFDFPGKEKDFDKVIEILNRNEEGLIDKNLGDGINSSTNESAPIQTADQNTMYFRAINREGFDNQTSDIFVSKRVDGVWQKAYKLEASFNKIDNQESPQGVSTDGNTLYLFGNYEGSLGNGDLFYAERIQGDIWSDAIHFPEPINSKYFESDAKLTNNGDALIFSSDRPGGVGVYQPIHSTKYGSKYGNTDIYVSNRTEDGWGPAINLGEKINTGMAERKPFLHPDGISLYFSSDGHPGLGRLDVFYAKRTDELAWDKWEEPINLGKEINSPSDESGVIVNTYGELAYFASADRDLNFGQKDIYTMNMPEALKPSAVTSLTGKVTDADGFPLEAEIIWEDLETGKKLGKMKSHPTNGTFFIVLRNGRNYGIYAEKEGYFPISTNIDLTSAANSGEMSENIQMQSLDDLLGDDLEMTGNTGLLYDAFSLQAKRKIKMNNLFFEYNKWDLLPISFPELDRIVYFLNNYPIQKIEIAGHTDSIGRDAYNEKLSKKRADAVVKYFVSKGIKKEMFVAVGYGKTQPVESNETEEGRRKNRRVELVILESSKRVAQEK